MSSTKFLTGSICLTDLSEQEKKQHSAITRSANGKLYVNIKLFLADDTDNFGNNGAILLNPKKDAEQEKHYIGNVKYVKSKESKTDEHVKKVSDVEILDDLPF